MNTNNTIIKVFIVDDHLVVREGITSLLTADKSIDIVGQAANAAETIAQIDELKPDIVLMDMRMPGIDGIKLTKMVKDILPDCRVIVFTLYDQYVTEAVEAGASGYLLKDITLEDLVGAIKRVYGGEKVIDKHIRSAVEVDYEPADEKPGDGAAEGVKNAVYDQVRVLILPPADVGASLRLTSVLEEALIGDFKQVEGTNANGIMVTFNLNRALPESEITKRISGIQNIIMVNYAELDANDSLKGIVKEQDQFDLKHPWVKTVFVHPHSLELS